MLTSVSLERRIAIGRFRRTAHIAMIALGVFVILVLIVMRVSSAQSVLRADAASVPASRAEAALQRRLGIARSVDVGAGMRERQALLQRTVTVRFVREDDSLLAETIVALKNQPSWVAFEERAGALHAAVRADRIAQSMREAMPVDLREAVSCELLSAWIDRHGVERAQTSCTAKPGDEMDVDQAATMIAEALQEGREEVIVRIRHVEPTIRMTVDGQEMTLRHLATGHSMFKGSGLGRKANVRKALSEHVHNVLVPQGGVLSFADAIGDPVTTGNGWHMALTIFEGQNLRPAPGGGMCQASTTLYRAALRAGLPILEQKNHSLYVTFYEQGGVGQDATVFPGQQDFKVRNDTSGPLLVQAYTDGDDAYVSVYGIPDDRTVSLEGPYFTATTPAAFTDQGRTLRSTEIGWVRSIVRPDGTTARELLVSRYKSIPRSLASRFSPTTEITMGSALHAAAPQESLP